MKTITIEIPDSIQLEEFDVKMLLASQLYEKGQLSLGQSAGLVGITKQRFMELIANYGVSIFNYSANDLVRDVANAQSHHI